MLTASLQNKNPLTPAQVFQDVPADHAFKTMTMEPFPHSGQQLASVHPCKHASVMKKFIDRMDAQAEVASGGGASGSTAPGAGAPGGSGRRKWGIGGMVRKVTGGSGGSKDKKEDKGEEGDEAEEKGVQVDFYLVIVSPQMVWTIAV